MDGKTAEALAGVMRRADVPWSRDDYRCHFAGGPHDTEERFLPDTGLILDPAEGPPLRVVVGFDTDPTWPAPGEDRAHRSSFRGQGVYTRGEATRDVPRWTKGPVETTWRYVWTPAGVADAPTGVACALVWRTEPPDPFCLLHPAYVLPREQPTARPDYDHLHADLHLGWPVTDGAEALRVALRNGHDRYLCRDGAAADLRGRGLTFDA